MQANRVDWDRPVMSVVEAGHVDRIGILDSMLEAGRKKTLGCDRARVLVMNKLSGLVRSLSLR